jgi:hypothetical protein
MLNLCLPLGIAVHESSHDDQADYYYSGQGFECIPFHFFPTINSIALYTHVYRHLYAIDRHIRKHKEKQKNIVLCCRGMDTLEGPRPKQHRTIFVEADTSAGWGIAESQIARR